MRAIDSPDGRSAPCWPSCLAGAALLLHAAGALAADAGVTQLGTSGFVQVEQVASGGSVQVLQSGAANQVQVLQAGAEAADLVEVVQSGTGNRADLVQAGLGLPSQDRLVAVRQAGADGRIDILQASAGGTAVVYQSPLSSGGQASLVQTALAPLGVIEQGVPRQNRAPLDAPAEAVLARSGALPAATSTQASASLVQAGGAGLSGIIVQSGAGQSASIAQAGSYLEAEIVQSGGAHAAAISQAGAGSAASPYRASIMQFGAQPQSVNITQTAGQSPRVIRVIQQ